MTSSEPPSNYFSLLYKWYNTHIKKRFFTKESDPTTMEEMMEEAEDAQGIPFEEDERTMLSKVFMFRSLKVDDVMIPRTDITAIEEDASLATLKTAILKRGHTRVPIYRESLDSIIGFINAKDMLSYLGTDKPFRIEEILRKILFIPASMKVMDLLRQMRFSGTHIAIVIDEYGGTDGLVTIEDLVEEIVGDIKDEYDDHEKTQHAQDWIESSAGSWEATGRLPIERLEKLLNITFADPGKEEEFDTLGGLIVSLTDSIPEKGEKVEHPAGVIFEILDRDPRHIKKVLVQRKVHISPTLE